jgi:primosomal protein N' (replication factor Y)
LQDLVNNGYEHFAQQALSERQQAQLPPYSYQALFRAEANYPSYPQNFLHTLNQTASAECMVAGPVPAAMEKKAGKYRFHLLMQSANRKSLHQDIANKLALIEADKSKNKVRWSVDIDPQDLNW